MIKGSFWFPKWHLRGSFLPILNQEFSRGHIFPYLHGFQYHTSSIKLLLAPPSNVLETNKPLAGGFIKYVQYLIHRHDNFLIVQKTSPPYTLKEQRTSESVVYRMIFVVLLLSMKYVTVDICENK